MLEEVTQENGLGRSVNVFELIHLTNCDFILTKYFDFKLLVRLAAKYGNTYISVTLEEQCNGSYHGKS